MSILKQNQKGSSRVAWVGFILVAVVVMIILSALSPSQPAQRRSNPTIPSVGAILQLYASTGAIPVGMTGNSLGELENAQVAQDGHGQAQLVRSGKILLVSNETRVRLLRLGLFQYEVRILEGRYEGRKGWVPREFVKVSTR